MRNHARIVCEITMSSGAKSAHMPTIIIILDFHFLEIQYRWILHNASNTCSLPAGSERSKPARGLLLSPGHLKTVND